MQLFANSAVTSLASGILAGDLSLTVATGDGAMFPSPSAPDYFLATLVQGTNIEIIKVTARSGDIFTIVRAFESVGLGGATAYAFTTGAGISCRDTKGTLNDIVTNTNPAYTVLVDGSTITWATAGARVNNGTVTLGGDRLLAMTGLVNGASGRLIINNANAHILTLPSGSRMAGVASGTTLVVAPTVADVIRFTYDGTSPWWESTSFASPPTIPGLLSWLKADAGVTLNSTTVSAWADQSGNGANATQATGAKQPLFVASGLNSLPVIRFDGAAQFFQWALSLGGAKTIAAVVKLNATPGAGTSFSLLSTKSGAALFQEVSGQNNAGYQPYSWIADVGSSGLTAVGIADALNTSVHKFITAYAGGGSSTTAQYTARLDSTAKSVVASSTYARTTTDLASIGARCTSGNVGSAFASMDLAELIAYNRALTFSEQVQLESYLFARWAV